LRAHIYARENRKERSKKKKWKMKIKMVGRWKNKSVYSIGPVQNWQVKAPAWNPFR
jgi:hypothetical protein